MPIDASAATNLFFINTSSAIRLSILADSASNCSVLTFPATTISNSDIWSRTLFKSLPLGDGDVILPVTVAVWFFIITVTLSPSAILVVDETGVKSSEPSN